MKFYPDADISFFVDQPGGWDRYQRHEPKYSWKLHKPENSKVMLYWRDIDGAKKPEITRKDLYFQKWPKSRIREQACLGMLFATGYRFIKLSKAPPAGFKCAPLPINLETARKVRSALRKRAKAAKRAAKKAKREAKRLAKEAKLKNKKKAKK